MMHVTYSIAGLHMYRAILSVGTSTTSLLFHQSCKNQVPYSQNAMAHNLFSQLICASFLPNTVLKPTKCKTLIQWNPDFSNL